MDIQEIIKLNYQAVVKRGLITPETTFDEFIEKIKEETEELRESWFYKPYNFGSFDELELADIILVCLAIAEHYNIDIIKRLEEKTIINQIRAI